MAAEEAMDNLAAAIKADEELERIPVPDQDHTPINRTARKSKTGIFANLIKNLNQMKSIILFTAVGLICMSGCYDLLSEDSHTINRNVRTVNLYVEEIWNNQNLSLLDSIIDDDFIVHCA